MPPPLLQLKDIMLTLGGKPLLSGADLSVLPGERVALIGRNGSGKSTLLKIAAGQLELDGGTHFITPSARVRYLPQEPDLSGFATTQAYVEAGLDQHIDFDFATKAHLARLLLQELMVPPDANPANLSGGEARRVALASVIVAEPDLLLLDEPTNHLDLPTIEWFEARLVEMGCALVMISHDRRFLQNLSQATVWLDRGKTRRMEEGFGAFEAWRDRILEEEEISRHKRDRQIVREEDWVRHGVSGRRKRNQGRLERLNALRAERRESYRRVDVMALEATDSMAVSKLLIEARKITKSYGARTIVQPFSVRILRGDRVGIVGENGAGKSTLIKMLIGAMPPDQGTVKLAQTLELALLEQGRDSLEPTVTLADAITGGGTDMVSIGDRQQHIMGLLQKFLFRPEQARTPIGKLSGGERARVMLARALLRPSNLIVLDEPTNDLDMETLDVLQDMLADYAGTVIIVSHDRDFLDRFASAIIMADGDGNFTTYAGGYSDMVAQRGAGVKARREAEKVASKAAKKNDREVQETASGGVVKLSFTERHRLKTLPELIARERKTLAALHESLSAPDLFEKDPKKFNDLTRKTGALQKALEGMEEEWLALEMKQESA